MNPNEILSKGELIFLKSTLHVELKERYSSNDWVELIEKLQDEYLNFTDEKYNPSENGLKIEKIVDHLTEEVG